jgi:hypothetical protein
MAAHRRTHGVLYNTPKFSWWKVLALVCVGPYLLTTAQFLFTTIVQITQVTMYTGWGVVNGLSGLNKFVVEKT